MRLAGPLLALALTGAGGLAGCRTPPPLAADLARAQAAERTPDPAAALAEYEALYQGCRRGEPARTLREGKDDCGSAAFRRAQQLEALGRDAEAAQAFLDVRAVSRDGRTIARALVRAAQLYAERLQQPGAALALCREVVPRWPDEIPAEDALRLQVRLQQAAADPSLPAELDRIATQQRPHETLASFALLHAGQWYEAQGQVEPAVARYDQIWQRYPRGPLLDDALWAAAKLLRRQGRPAEAAARLERLQQTFRPAILIGHYNLQLLDEGALLLGEIYLHDLKQPAQATAALQGFVKRQPTSLLADDALVLLAEAALADPARPQAQAQREACDHLARLARDYPDSNQRRRATALGARIGCPRAPEPPRRSERAPGYGRSMSFFLQSATIPRRSAAATRWNEALALPRSPIWQ